MGACRRSSTCTSAVRSSSDPVPRRVPVGSRPLPDSEGVEGGLGTRSPARYKSISWMFAWRSGYGGSGTLPDWARWVRCDASPSWTESASPRTSTTTSSSHGAQVIARNVQRMVCILADPERLRDAMRHSTRRSPCTLLVHRLAEAPVRLSGEMERRRRRGPRGLVDRLSQPVAGRSGHGRQDEVSLQEMTTGYRSRQRPLGRVGGGVVCVKASVRQGRPRCRLATSRWRPGRAATVGCQARASEPIGEFER